MREVYTADLCDNMFCDVIGRKWKDILQEYEWLPDPELFYTDSKNDRWPKMWWTIREKSSWLFSPALRMQICNTRILQNPARAHAVARRLQIVNLEWPTFSIPTASSPDAAQRLCMTKRPAIRQDASNSRLTSAYSDFLFSSPSPLWKQSDWFFPSHTIDTFSTNIS